MKTEAFDVVVLGGGAAGLMAAATAGHRGRRVLLLEHNDRPGRKILISGGGRCNFTNLGARAENYISENPHFARSALAGYTPQDFIALVRKHQIPFHEKTLGQLFCDESAQRILDMLLTECRDAQVVIRTGVSVEQVQPDAQDDVSSARFAIATSSGRIHAGSVIVATGGLSIPKLGATGTGYEIAKAFGLRIVPTRDALVPFTFSERDRNAWCDLSGISAEVTIETAATGSGRGKRNAAPVRFREKLLLTHRGISGPAVLQVSSYWKPGQAVVVDLAPGRKVLDELIALPQRDDAMFVAALRQIFPARFAERWLLTRSPHGWTNAALDTLERELHEWQLVPAGTEGFAKAEVTAGGVDTAELNARTLECRKVPGLFFIGEVVDVTGWLGGYNFQWAWASGVAAGGVA